MKTLALIILLFSLNTYALEAGFEHTGGTLDIVTLEGNLTLTCNEQYPGNPPHTEFVKCNSYVTSHTHDRFVTSEKIKANKLILKATRENGSTKTKKVKFNGKRSKEVNLLVNTLFQNPLLKLGDNHVEWTLMNRKKAVRSGSFNVRVQITEERRCQQGYEHSNSQCSHSIACDRYFRKHNNCQ